MSKCECCGQVIREKRAPRAAKQGQTKALRDDLAKAQSACDVLARQIERRTSYEFVEETRHGEAYKFIRDGIPMQSLSLVPSRLDFVIACDVELERMKRALVEPRLLWSIYRRACKKPMAVVYGTL